MNSLEGIGQLSDKFFANTETVPEKKQILL